MNFLEFCKTKIYGENEVIHKHHIQPEYDGGPLEEWNLIRLNREDHIEAHKILWEEFGNVNDLAAITLLSRAPHGTKQEMSWMNKMRWEALSAEKKAKCNIRTICMSKTAEERSAISKKGWDIRTPEEKKAHFDKLKKSISPERRKEIARLNNEKLGPEGRSQRVRNSWKNSTPEQKKLRARKGKETLGPERLSEIVRKGWSKITPEERTARAKKACATRKLNREHNQARLF